MLRFVEYGLLAVSLIVIAGLIVSGTGTVRESSGRQSSDSGEASSSSTKTLPS